MSQDTDVYGDYTNEGSTIIQVGTLRIYGDLTNLGTMSGDYSTSRMGGEGPQAGDGLSIAGAYTIGRAASLVMPQPIWRLRVGGDLDIAIDDPSRFAMAQATIELTGQAPGGQQTIETLGDSFPVGTLRIAAGADVTVVDDRVNQLEGGGEDLHVDTLVIEAGASLTTAGHRIHVRNLILEGTVDDEGNLIEIEACPADLNGDGSVDGIDLSMILGAWKEYDSDADLDGDGVVGGSDLAIILAAWDQPCDGRTRYVEDSKSNSTTTPCARAGWCRLQLPLAKALTSHTPCQRSHSPNILSQGFDILSNPRAKRLKCDSPMTSGGGFTWCQPILNMPVSPVHLRDSPLRMKNKDTAPRALRGAVSVFQTRRAILNRSDDDAYHPGRPPEVRGPRARG